MHIISLLYKKFSILFRSSENKKEVQKTSYIGAITFKLLPTYNIDIVCDIPDVKNLGSAEISILAERYAEFLLLINKGFFKKQIFELLDKTYRTKDSEENNQYLFIDNVITFTDILNSEYKKIKKDNSLLPLIRPSQVFRNP
jgi:hypothetical protein